MIHAVAWWGSAILVGAAFPFVVLELLGRLAGLPWFAWWRVMLGRGLQ